MGNVINVSLKEDRQLEITEQLVRDFQDQVSLVDTSMAGLVKTLDSLKVSCELFLRQVDSTVNSSVDSKEKDDQNQIEDVAELAVRLLKTIHDSVLDQKKTAMESLTKLLHSVINTGRRCVNVSDEDIMLSLDEYMTQLNEDDTIIETRPYYETRVELLRNELKIAKKLNKIQGEQITVLNDKNKTYNKEIEVLRRRNQVLEDEQRDFEAERLKLEEENHRLEIRFKDVVEGKENLEKKLITVSAEIETDKKQGQACLNEARIPARAEKNLRSHPCDVERWTSNENKTDIEKLRKELKSVTSAKESLESEMKMITSKECIHVQIINRTTTATPLSDLISLLTSHVDTPLRQLYIITHKDEKTELEKLKAQIPLIIFFCPTGAIQQSALRALRDINNDVESLALVAVHRVDSPPSVRASEHVLQNEKFKRLTGIFDFVYSFNRLNGFYQCDLNERNISDLVDFIKEKGKRISALETYGLKSHVI